MRKCIHPHRQSVAFFTYALLLSGLLWTTRMWSQSEEASVTVVPSLIRYSGWVKNADGSPRSGVVGITFAFYAERSGSAPLWEETQNAYADVQGRYTVYLGSTNSRGIPQSLFVNGEARWLGVRVEGQAESSRTQLMSVPYALKAGDAQTFGGLPPSAFVLAVPPNANSISTGSASVSAQPLATTPVTTAGGTINKLAKFDATADVTNSQIFDNGTNVGIGNTAPGARLDVSGAGIFRGLLSLPATGTATATAGKNSQPIGWTTSVFNSGTATAVNQVFRWQGEPVGNNTTTPSGTLNLLFGTGTSAPVETGLKIASNGRITFAVGQVFPGTGTITGVTAGTGLSGGGTSGVVPLSLNTTFTDGRYAQLAANNTFSGVQVINKNVGIGTVPNPVFALQAIGTIRSENGGLSIGGNAPVNVDAAGISGGRLTILSNGNVGINNNLPANKLNVAGSNATGEVVLAAQTSGHSATSVSGVASVLDNCGADELCVATGVSGKASGSAGNTGVLGSVTGGGIGVSGVADSTGTGVAGSAPNTGVQGTASSSTFFAAGVWGDAPATSGTTRGVYGTSESSQGIGVHGIAATGGQFETGSGNILVGRGSGHTTFRVDATGKVFADGGFQGSGADFAESFAVAGLRQRYEPGDLLAIDPKGSRRMILASRPYSKLVAGIYSTKPGLLGTPHRMSDPELQDEVPLAIVGVVPCKVSGENGPIRPGDLLVSSGKPGYAMRASDRKRMLGAVVGKALEPMSGDMGVIQVLVTLQ